MSRRFERGKGGGIGEEAVGSMGASMWRRFRPLEGEGEEKIVASGGDRGQGGFKVGDETDAGVRLSVGKRGKTKTKR
jgi:hypothetical protein